MAALLDLLKTTTEQWAALYCRLSRDDENEGDRTSISNQKNMLEKSAHDNGYTNWQFYVEKSVIVGIKSRRLLRHKALLV